MKITLLTLAYSRWQRTAPVNSLYALSRLSERHSQAAL